MSFKWYHLITAFCAALLFVTPAKAFSTTTVSASFTNSDNDTMGITNVKTFSAYPYDEAEQIDEGYIYSWTNNQNPILTGFTRYKYYTGGLVFRINITPSQSNGMSRTMPVLYTENIADGVHIYIEGTSVNWYQMLVLFDNYYAISPELGLGTITQKFTFTEVDPIAFPESFNFNASITNITTTLRSTENALDGGLAGLIADSIDNSIKVDMIMGYLYDIRENDYDYYTGLSAQIASILSAQGTTNARLQSILNEIDVDFAAVQTVLDLFPSYRTQVLQYWQQLLEMNAAQSSAAADIESQYADRDNQSETLLSGLGDINFPTISAGDLNVLQNVDQNTKTDFFGLISLITNNGLITNILLIAVTAMIAGFALYGKKH